MRRHILLRTLIKLQWIGAARISIGENFKKEDRIPYLLKITSSRTAVRVDSPVILLPLSN